MANQPINLGTAPLGEDGDTVRQAFTKVNANADELYAASDAAATKLATIATGATANATDAQLRNRATHTGTQAISTVTGLVTELAGKQASNANLNALAGLAGAADRLPYFTGAGALSLTTLTAAARTFLAASTAESQRTALGLGNAATRTALGSTGALYSRDSIFGTVSQSGGVPTGAIIESGSNSNGHYIKYADGTMICRKSSAAAASLTTTNGVGAGFQGVGLTSISFPTTFAAIPTVNLTAEFVANSRAWISLSSRSTTGFTCIAHSFNSDAEIQVEYEAIGRWY